MDDPHLVAMENRLQDLLDAVTAADSTCISAGGPGAQEPGGVLCGTWGVPAWRGRGGQGIKALSATWEQRC